MVVCGEGVAICRCFCEFNMFKIQELVIQEKRRESSELQ